jgi:hypothetical protein
MPQLEASPEVREALEVSWRELGEVGTWWTGPARVAMVAETRAARRCTLCADRKAALSPYAVKGSHAATGELSAPVVDAVHRLATDPGRIGVRWMDELRAAGLEAEAVVELVAVVSTVCLADTLAVATAAPERELPLAGSGTPDRVRPPGLANQCAWVPTVDPEAAEGPVGAVYAMVQGMAGFVFHVARALSSVPAAMQTFFRSFAASYRTHGPTQGPLSRPQVEVLAASTSAINECFY